MTPEARERTRKAMIKKLGEPFAGGITDELAKTRLRLLLIGSLSIAIVAKELRIEKDATIFGLKIINLDDHLVRFALAAITAYLLVHFAVRTLETLGEWRLRLTGTEVFDNDTERSGNTPDGVDWQKDHRQSTLYSWWLRLNQDTRGDKEQLLKALETQRVGVSLERFDRWFRYFLRLQNVRWCVFDLLLPFAVGAAALGLLATDLCPKLRSLFP